MNDTVKDAVAQDVEAVTEDTKVVVIEVANPDAEAMAGIKESIKVNFDTAVVVKEVNFNFKKSVDKTTGVETIRKPVQLAVPYPSVDGIVTILEAGGKQLELLLEAMESVVNSTARDILYEDTTYNASTFPVEKISWLAISEIPKVQRKGGGIPKDVWEAFGADYSAVMPEVTGKTVEQIANAAKILVNKLSAVRTNMPVLELLVAQLAVYAEASPQIAEYADCVEFLLNKAETLLNVSDEELLAAL